MFPSSKCTPLESDSETVLSDCFAPESLKNLFKARAHTRSFACNEVLFQKGEAARDVFLVRSGEVKLLLPILPNRAMRFLAREGSLIGLPAAFVNQPYSVTAVALMETELDVLSSEGFREMVAADASLSFAVCRYLPLKPDLQELQSQKSAAKDGGLTIRVSLRAPTERSRKNKEMGCEKENLFCRAFS
jgi:CRP-like cAMP-binding protein